MYPANTINVKNNVHTHAHTHAHTQSLLNTHWESNIINFIICTSCKKQWAKAAAV